MSNLADHDGLGMTVGAGIALALAVNSNYCGDFLDVLVEIIGGITAGKVGSRLPDAIEPPTSSWHRSTAHSVMATSAVAALGIRKGAPVAEQLRAKAEQARNLASERPEDAQHYQLVRILSRFAAGVAVGAPSGYVSHTLLDSLTPRCIPLITKGF